MVHNFYMANNNSLGIKPLSITWSIGIEEQFYLFFPTVVILLKKWGLVIILLTAIIAAPVLRYQYKDWIPAYVLLQCRMDSISFGALIAFASYYFNLKSIIHKYFWLLVIIMIGDILACLFLYSIYGDLGAVRHSLIAIFFSGILLIALTKQTLFSAVLTNKTLIWFGNISYSLYLFHYLILGIFHYISGKQGISIMNEKDIIVSFLALSTSLLFSYLVYKFWEKPAVTWGRKTAYT